MGRTSGARTVPTINNSQLEGVPITAYGHSVLAEPTAWTLKRYPERLASRMGSTLRNLGISGASVVDCCNFAHGTQAEPCASGTVAGTWTASDNPQGLVLIDAVGDDSGWAGLSSTKAQSGFKYGLDSLIRLLRAGAVVQDTDASFVYTGAWTSLAGTMYAGGNCHYTTTPGDHVDITVPSGQTEWDFILLGYDHSYTGAAYTVTVDSVSQNTALSTAGYPVSANAALYEDKLALLSNAAWVNMCVPITGLNPATTHTVRFTHAGTAGQYLTVCRYMRPSVRPPTIIINKCAQRLPAGYTAYTGASASWATDQVFNGLVDTVVNRFPADGSVKVFDPNTNVLWSANLTNYIASTDTNNLHFNDLGMSFYADNLMQLINGLTPRIGLVVI